MPKQKVRIGMRVLTVALALAMLVGFVAPIASACNRCTFPQPNTVHFRGTSGTPYTIPDLHIVGRNWVSGSHVTRGNLVRIVQAAINCVGAQGAPGNSVLFSTGVIDGWWGENTDRGIRAYQRHRNLTPDGIVGPNTWNRLCLDRGSHTGFRLATL